VAAATERANSIGGNAGPEKIAGPAVYVGTPAVCLENCNAANYGALSTPRGRLLIAWHIDEVGEEPNLNFSWVERDGPPVKVPAEEGFGTRLISASLNGTSSVSYAETGLEFRADVPLSQIMFGKHGSG
jgi:hypothetical protein